MPGFSNITGDESIMFADNASFDGTERGGKLTTNGQLWIGASSSPHVRVGSLTSSDNSITWTVGAGSISGVVAGGTTVGKTITGDSGGAISPTAGNWNIVGTGSITTSGSGSTLTAQLTGLTNHAVQVGAGTATLTQLAVGTNGQVLVGATAANPAFATLTSSDSSISFTTGANSLSLQVAGGTTVGKTITGDSGGALSPTAGNWNILGGPGVTTSGSGSTLTINSVVFTDTTAATLASDNGYFATAAGTYTLPAAPAQGETVIIFCDTAGAVAVTANTGQVIRIGNQVSSTAGSLTSTARGDALTLRYRSSGSVWATISSMGNWTVA